MNRRGQSRGDRPVGFREERFYAITDHGRFLLAGWPPPDTRESVREQGVPGRLLRVEQEVKTVIWKAGESPDHSGSD